MFWTIIILIVALVGTNLAWLIYESQFDCKSNRHSCNSGMVLQFDNKLFSDIIIYRPKFFHFPNPFGRLE